MQRTALWEFLVLSLLLALFICLLLPAAQYSRRKYRDDIRIQQLAELKTSLEQYNNKYEMYPLNYPDTSFQYIITEENGISAISWFIRTPLENSYSTKIDFDEEAGRNYLYRIIRLENKTFYDIAGGNETFDTE